MPILAKILADSVSPDGHRLTTFLLTYPRFIHCEVMTHRVFSRNAASSRAIPVAKTMQRVKDCPVVPVHWGRNQRGMRADASLSRTDGKAAMRLWLDACEAALGYAQALSDLGVHKQVVNRLLEPFARIQTLVTATEWGNFFHQRCHPDAQPEFQALAYAMLEAYIASTPTLKESGQWHLAFADPGVLQAGLTVEHLLKIVTARAARLSYANFAGEIDYADDYRLHDDLVAKGHWSPFEHAACVPMPPGTDDTLLCSVHLGDRSIPIRRPHSNLRGWIQYRKLFSIENRSLFNPRELLRTREAS